MYITAASRAIDRHTNRQFGLVAAPEERFYTPWYDSARCRWIFNIDDLMTIVGFGFTIDGDAVTDYTLEPRNAAAEGKPWTHLVARRTAVAYFPCHARGVQVTANWGWSAVPDTIKQATLLQANRILSRRSAAFGVTGSPEMGGELRLLSHVDPDVAVALRPYKRWWGAR